MRVIQHLLPCGRIIFIHRYVPTDLVNKQAIRNHILNNKKEFSKLVHPDTVGRKKKEWSDAVYGKFVTLLVKKLVDHLMESDRIETSPGVFWCIGVVGGSDKFANWHTDGDMYAIKVQGIKTKYRFKMSRKRGKELQQRILKGQKFHP
jgi:hypothetical protein